MSLAADARTLLRLARFGLTMALPDAHAARRVPGNPKFTSADDAVGRIPDGAVVAVSGLGGHQRASALYRALRRRFERTGHPRGISVVNVGGHGGRGKLPGTLEELAVPGLCARLVTSHFETFHAFLALAAAGRCELQCLPLGILAALYEAHARGEDSVLSPVGVGTFLDPRVGRGSPVQRGRRAQWITAEGDRLRYRLPPIDVAIFNLPAADRRGALYAGGAAMVGDSREIARAARRHGGLVLANVGRLERGRGERPFLPAGLVDAIVWHPDTEQTLGFFHRAPWRVVTPEGKGSVDEALAYVRRVRRFGEAIGGFPRRSALDDAVARLAAGTLAAATRRGARVAIGTGLPEEVPRAAWEMGWADAFTFMVESGVVGGLPASGPYFGAAFGPHEMISTARFFARCRQRLDAACLGALEVDGAGNVNVSRRGPGARGAVGPGGFADFTEAARTIVFVSGWMRGGALAVEGDRVRLTRVGRPKFVPRLQERTFDAARALRAGKRLLYATPVGLLRATARGLELLAVMPGVDPRRDVLGVAGCPIRLPRGPLPELPRALLGGDAG